MDTEDRDVAELLAVIGVSREEAEGKIPISIVNRAHTAEGEYVGRPSPLGNPFLLGDGITRDEAIRRYRVWINKQMVEGNKTVLHELERLRLKAKADGKLVLSCRCSPKACHAEVIAEILRFAVTDDIALAYVEPEGAK